MSVTWWTDDRKLYLEQRRLDAMQAEAKRRMTPEQRALTEAPLSTHTDAKEAGE